MYLLIIFNLNEQFYELLKMFTHRQVKTSLGIQIFISITIVIKYFYITTIILFDIVIFVIQSTNPLNVVLNFCKHFD